MSEFTDLVAMHQKRLIAQELNRLNCNRTSSQLVLETEQIDVPASAPAEKKVNQNGGRDFLLNRDLIYQVQCKVMNRYCRVDPSLGASVLEGSVVIISAEVEGCLDVGVVVRIYSGEGFAKRLATTRPFNDKEEGEIRRIVRLATSQDLSTLAGKHAREEQLLQECQSQVKSVFCLPIDVYGAEFELGGSVLTFYYTSAVRADFRGLVRAMQALCKVRVRMRKTNQCKKFVPVASASEILRTGVV